MINVTEQDRIFIESSLENGATLLASGECEEISVN